MFDTWLQVIKFAHSKICVNEQAFVNIWAAESKTCLYLLPVVMRDSVHCYFPFERTFELQQDNGVGLVQKVTVGAARHYFVKQMILCKIQRNTVAKYSHTMLLFEVFSHNRLEKSYPTASDIALHGLRLYLFKKRVSNGECPVNAATSDALIVFFLASTQSMLFCFRPVLCALRNFMKA